MSAQTWPSTYTSTDCAPRSPRWRPHWVVWRRSPSRAESASAQLRSGSPRRKASPSSASRSMPPVTRRLPARPRSPRAGQRCGHLSYPRARISRSRTASRRCYAVAETAPVKRTAVRALIHGDVQAVGFREAVVARARELGIQGWVRHGEDGAVALHAEGEATALEQLTAFLSEG